MRATQVFSAGARSAKLECFESIRGLASFAVLVGHIILGFWPELYARNGPRWEAVPGWLQALARFPGKFLWNGETAVTIFFVLSGFVLSLSFFQAGSPRSLGSAAVRRYPRLMLPVAASVLLAFLLLWTGAIRSQETVRFMDQAQGITYDPHAAPGHSNNWLRACYNFPPEIVVALRQATWTAFTGYAVYNPVLWTMPIELTGSFLVFGFLAVFGCVRNRWLLYSICGGLLAGHGQDYMLDFLLGIAGCDLWVHNQKIWKKSLPPAPAVVLLALALFVVPWKSLTALMVVGVTAAAPGVQEWLNARWLTFLGRISFTLYLVHMPIFCSLGCGLYLLLCRDLGWSHIAGSLGAAGAVLAGSLLTAWVFYHAVDRPAITLTRWLDAWFFRSTGTAETAPASTRSALPMARAARAA
jgi:peptidoglycan/LPS O-acetylase OafA/YrhL